MLSCFTAACMPSAIKLHTTTPPHPPTLSALPGFPQSSYLQDLLLHLPWPVHGSAAVDGSSLHVCVCACCSAALHVCSCCHHVTVPLHACLSTCSMLSTPVLRPCMHACSMTSCLHAACTHSCFHACSVCLHCHQAPHLHTHPSSCFASSLPTCSFTAEHCLQPPALQFSTCVCVRAAVLLFMCVHAAIMSLFLSMLACLPAPCSQLLSFVLACMPAP